MARSHLTPRHRAARYSWTQKNILNGLVRIGITFYSQVSVAYAFNRTIVGDVFGGSLVRLNVLDTLPSECSKAVVPLCFGVALCRADVRHWWS